MRNTDDIHRIKFGGFVFMKMFISILFSLFFTQVISQTTRFNIQYDFYGSGEAANSVIETKNGFLVGGGGYDTLSEKFIAFLELDKNGNIQSRKEYKKSGADLFLLKGIPNYLDSTTTYISNIEYFSGPVGCGILRTNMHGDTLWHKLISDTAFNQQLLTINQMPNGDYLFTGQSTEFDSTVDIFLMRTDSLGNQIWVQHYPMSGTYEKTFKVTQMLNGDFLISSSTYNYTTQIGKPRLIIVDSLGNFKREKIYGSPSFTNGAPIAFQTDTNEIWSFAFEGDFDSGASISGDVNLKKLDTSLNVIDTIFVHDGVDTYGGIKDVVLEYDNIYAVTIEVNWSIIKNSMTLLKYDYSGDLLRKRMYDVYDWADLASQLIRTSDSGFMMVGTTQPYTMTQDWKMVKADSLGCDTLGCEIYDNVEELPLIQKYKHIEVYPNPANDIVFLKIDEETGFDFLGGTIELFDNMGKLVFEKSITHSFSHSAQINLTDLPQGIYIGRVSVKNNVIGNFKIVKQ